jgi:predicted Zn-dependent protease with MMP-like domain
MAKIENKNIDLTDLPDLADIYSLAYRTIDRLPARYKPYTRNLIIRVENFADQDTLYSLDMVAKNDLLGLYRGVPLPLKGANDGMSLPDVIFLYRAPLILYARDNGEDLEKLINNVMIHEISHHFGFQDLNREFMEE